MKTVLILIATIIVTTFISVYCVNWAVDLRGGDMCQYALDKHYQGKQPHIRHWHLTKQIGDEKLYLVEYQYGAENDKPHLVFVVVKPNKSKVVQEIQ